MSKHFNDDYDGEQVDNRDIHIANLNSEVSRLMAELGAVTKERDLYKSKVENLGLDGLVHALRDGAHVTYGTKESVLHFQNQYQTLELDSKRWSAFLNSPFRLFGFAGLDRNDMTKPGEHGQDGYAHFGCEMWTKHSGWEPDGKDLLIGFADQAIRVQSEGKKDVD